jgi:hypothetical protein
MQVNKKLKSALSPAARPHLRVLVLVCLAIALCACSSIMRKVQNGVAQQLTQSALNHDDPETVGAALPSYLLLLDASANDPDADGAALCSAAQLYGAYAGGFVSDTLRQQRLAARALRYGTRGACALTSALCDAHLRNFEALDAVVKTLDADALPALACLGNAWATDVQARADQPDAQADAPKVRVLYERVVAIDPAFNNGEAHMVLGVMNSLLPPALGGKPDIGAMHFKKALAISQQKNLMAKVLYAQYFARLTFDQALHDKLLNEVLAAPSEAKDLTLSNQIAKGRAQALLLSGKDYF